MVRYCFGCSVLPKKLNQSVEGCIIIAETNTWHLYSNCYILVVWLFCSVCYELYVYHQWFSSSAYSVKSLYGRLEACHSSTCVRVHTCACIYVIIAFCEEILRISVCEVKACNGKQPSEPCCVLGTLSHTACGVITQEQGLSGLVTYSISLNLLL